ncbi:hypothetical protein [Nonomuraea cavernae]|uniref:hypothetical protein n=1 Tax=Nonomuraea cavernae TaxID=2045107 RepID=UPI0033CDEEE7
MSHKRNIARRSWVHRPIGYAETPCAECNHALTLRIQKYAGHMPGCVIGHGRLCGPLTETLRGFTARAGLDLVGIYIDQHAYRRSAFGELLQALCRPDVTVVVIPTSEHLSEFDGIYQAMRALIEIETGADVLVMSHKSEATA